MQCNYNNVKYIEHLEIIFETHHMKTDKTEKWLNQRIYTNVYILFRLSLFAISIQNLKENSKLINTFYVHLHKYCKHTHTYVYRHSNRAKPVARGELQTEKRIEKIDCHVNSWRIETNNSLIYHCHKDELKEITRKYN